MRVLELVSGARCRKDVAEEELRARCADLRVPGHVRARRLGQRSVCRISRLVQIAAEAIGGLLLVESVGAVRALEAQPLIRTIPRRGRAEDALAAKPELLVGELIER